jgi:hypothetical protein
MLLLVLLVHGVTGEWNVVVAHVRMVVAAATGSACRSCTPQKVSLV